MNVTDTCLLMTVLNRETTLAEAIESALAQTHQAFELLIWDDGSTDRSLEIARSFAARDPRIRVVAATHKGRVASLIAALETTKAPFFGILDSDDRLRPRALEATKPILQANPDMGVVYTDRALINAGGDDLGPDPSNSYVYNPEQLLVSQMVFHFRLFRREIVDEVGGFDPDFETAQDYDLVIRLSEVSDIGHVPEVLYDHRVHEVRISANKRNEQRDASAKAVRAALVRRGVANKIALQVSPEGRFSLVPATS